MLSCTTASDHTAPEAACRRLAPFHTGSTPRARRYPSDTTDAQRALLDPLLPDPAWLAGKGGRPETHCRRTIVDAIFYVVDNGIKWRALPADFPSWSTVYNYFATWEAAGITQDPLDDLRDRVRLRDGRSAEPSTAIIDSQPVNAAETVPTSSCGFDAGKKINGRKRHIAADTLGLLLTVLVTAASTQDRDGARPLLTTSCSRVRLIWADDGLRRQATRLGHDHCQDRDHHRETKRRCRWLPGAATSVGRGAHTGLDHWSSPVCPR